MKAILQCVAGRRQYGAPTGLPALDSSECRAYMFFVVMPPAAENEIQATFLEAVRALPSESQRAVLSYALFLHHQEEARRVEADEAEWDRLFSQPDKMARFTEWARESLTQHPPEPLDDSRL